MASRARFIEALAEVLTCLKEIERNIPQRAGQGWTGTDAVASRVRIAIAIEVVSTARSVIIG